MKTAFYPHRISHLFLTLVAAAFIGMPIMSHGQTETQTHYLSGKGFDDPVVWDFFCTEGRKKGAWSKIGVPAHWEIEGFGTFGYGSSVKPIEIGKYKRTFKVPASWKKKRIKLVFEGSMTDTEVFVNGQSAGPVHQGAFYRFSFDITKLLKAGDNLLEVNVTKQSANDSVDKAERAGDYWTFGGIYRPVYLEALPREYIDWTSVDAQATGGFELDVYLQHQAQTDQVTAQISTLDGAPLGGKFSASVKKGSEKVRLSTKVSGQKNWTAEAPNLYQVKLDLRKGGKVVHTITRRFGFRTFEVRKGEGLFLNGSKIILKGVNRHCFWPDSGRCLNRALSYSDVALIKEMNMNAVRMSHYPPDVHFLEACDEEGLYVLDELAGWSKPPYDTPTGERLVGQMVKRDQMHPSILFWDNGNENGWNTDLDDDFGLYDLQDRSVIHPWAKFEDMDTKHYPLYKTLLERLSGELVYFPTEFLHGLYDGGSGAGLEDYWDAIMASKIGAGGFLWVFSDEGVVRNDKDGWIDTWGNAAPDGVVGPRREKEGSFYAVRDVWAPVQMLNETLPETFDGKLEIQNRYDFRSLATCTFKWELIKFSSIGDSEKNEVVLKEGLLPGPSIAPHQKGTLELPLPKGWNKSDALRLTAFDAEKRELFTWSWSLKTPTAHLKRMAEKQTKGSLKTITTAKVIRVATGGFEVEFNAKTGRLNGLKKKGKKVSLANGPRLAQSWEAPADVTAPTVDIKKSRNKVVLTVSNPGEGLDALTWTVHSKGFLEMQCTYSCDGEYDFHGVAFDYPEELVQSKRWLGTGPYRVWKNRMKGPQFGLWQGDYNDPVPGESWIFPEFKGYFSHVNWLELDTKEGLFAIATNQENMFLRLYAPRDGKRPVATAVPTFEGGIAFLHAIPPIGEKIRAVEGHGPQSQKTKANGSFDISLFFFAEGME